MQTDSNLKNYGYQLIVGDNALPQLVFIHGYCQSGQETWGATVRELIRLGVKNPMLIIERKFGERAGRVTLGEQVAELREYIAQLMATDVIVRSPIWIGHSLGGLLADDLAATFPLRTAGVINIATVPTTGWWLLFSLGFWLNGGLISLPAVIWSIITGRSVRYPPEMARGLFAGPACPEDRFQQFLQVQQPDAAWIFPQVLLTYFLDDGDLRQLTQLGQNSRRLMIGCDQDALIPLNALVRFSELSDTNLAWVDAPHCWWLQDGSVSGMAYQIKYALPYMTG